MTAPEEPLSIAGSDDPSPWGTPASTPEPAPQGKGWYPHGENGVGGWIKITDPPVARLRRRWRSMFRVRPLTRKDDR